MKLADALSAVTRLFLDTSPVIYYVERNPAYTALVDDVFNRIDSATLFGVTSPITLAECLVVPIRSGEIKVQQDFIDLIVSGHGMTFKHLNEQTASRAAELRASYNVPLTDAFQVAAALADSCDAFLTNDLRLKRIRELPIIVFDELEVSP